MKDRIHSAKFSHAAVWQQRDLKDVIGQYQFLNMRAYLYWAIRDWIDPKKHSQAALPPDDELLQELTGTMWRFNSKGHIQIEAKEEIKKRIKRAPDKADALAETFWPVADYDPRLQARRNAADYFF